MDYKWVFKKKERVLVEELVRYKARLVAKGYTQKGSAWLQRDFSPIVKHTSIRILLALVA